MSLITITVNEHSIKQDCCFCLFNAFCLQFVSPIKIHYVFQNSNAAPNYKRVRSAYVFSAFPMKHHGKQYINKKTDETKKAQWRTET